MLLCFQFYGRAMAVTEVHDAHTGKVTKPSLMLSWSVCPWHGTGEFLREGVIVNARKPMAINALSLNFKMQA